MKTLIAIVLIMLPGCALPPVSSDFPQHERAVYGWLDPDGTVRLKQTR